VRVDGAEVEDDCPGRVVRDDSLVEVAAAVAAGTRSDDPRGGVGGWGGKQEDALERTPEVAGADKDAGRVSDSGAQSEAVPGAAVGRSREIDREVGHELQRLRTVGAGVGDERVVGQSVRLKRREVELELEIVRRQGP